MPWSLPRMGPQLSKCEHGAVLTEDTEDLSREPRFTSPLPNVAVRVCATSWTCSSHRKPHKHPTLTTCQAPNRARRSECPRPSPLWPDPQRRNEHREVKLLAHTHTAKTGILLHVSVSRTGSHRCTRRPQAAPRLRHSLSLPAGDRRGVRAPQSSEAGQARCVQYSWEKSCSVPGKLGPGAQGCCAEWEPVCSYPELARWSASSINYWGARPPSRELSEAKCPTEP